MNAAVLAFCNLAADGPAIIDLVPISAEIEPAGIGILRDDAVRGADIARLVQLVMPGHGNLRTSTLSPSMTFSRTGPSLTHRGGSSFAPRIRSWYILTTSTLRPYSRRSPSVNATRRIDEKCP